MASWSLSTGGRAVDPTCGTTPSRVLASPATRLAQHARGPGSRASVMCTATPNKASAEKRLLHAARKGDNWTLAALILEPEDTAAIDALLQEADIAGIADKDKTKMRNAAVMDAPSVNTATARGTMCDTAVMLAAAGGHTDCLERLLRAGADVDRVNAAGQNALAQAAARDDEDMVHCLLEHGAAADGCEGTAPLLLAARAGAAASAAALIAHGASADGNIDPCNGETPLMAAAQRGHDKVVTVLLDAGADTKARDANGFTALARAAGGMRRFAPEEGSEDTAVTRGREACIEALLKESDLDAAGQDGYTSLMLASEIGHTAAAEALADAGADVNAATTEGWTALMFAASLHHREIVVKLFAAGADVNAVAANGDTALLRSVAMGGSGRSDCAQLLVSSGADVHAADAAGETALMKIASFFNQGDGMELTTRDRNLLALLAAGADLTAVDSAGESAGFKAARAGCDDVWNAALQRWGKYLGTA